jgi:hypothetical protein
MPLKWYCEHQLLYTIAGYKDLQGDSKFLEIKALALKVICNPVPHIFLNAVNRFN